MMLIADASDPRAIAIVSLLLAGFCALVVVADVIRRPQRMTIMNVVWPITALYAGLLGLIAYFTIGVQGAASKERGRPPLAAAALTGSTHCGAGCAIGDVVATFGVFFLGIKIAGEFIWSYLIFDLLLAWLFGIVFQCFSIVPMRHLSFREGLVAAIKADTLSIVAFQAGMYAWMLLARFVLFGRDIPPTQPLHWFSMQIAMVIGIATTYPMNALLVRKGWKERM